MRSVATAMTRWAAWLAAMLVLPATTGHARWHAATSDHFIVYADDTEGEVRRYAEQLERYDKALRYFTRTESMPVSPSGRVNVFLLNSQDAVARLAGNDGVGGFYIPRAGDAVAFAPRPSGLVTLREGVDHSMFFHEYAHHFMLTTWPDGAFPAWFVEGFAELVSTALIGDANRITLGSAPRGAAFGLEHQKPIPSATLLVADPTAQSLTNGFYARAWLLTHS